MFKLMDKKIIVTLRSKMLLNWPYGYTKISVLSALNINYLTKRPTVQHLIFATSVFDNFNRMTYRPN